MNQQASSSSETYTPLSVMQRSLLFGLSLILVGFGQPAWSGVLAILTAGFGYALFWASLVDVISRQKTFWIATAWFTAVQLIQLSWIPSHPYLYIYGVYFLLSFAMGLQFGLLSLGLRPSLQHGVTCFLGMAGFWVILEWMRLYVLSGLPFNPVGLTLSTSVSSLQFASVAGIYGLSFWVILTNLLALRAWILSTLSPALLWMGVAILPYFFGMTHLWIHEEAFAKHEQQQEPYKAVLVQTAFPIEELIPLDKRKGLLELILDEWKQILAITKKQQGKAIDLIVLPEFVVPYSTFPYAYPHTEVVAIFKEILGSDSLQYLPKLEEPLAYHHETEQGHLWLVNNAFWAQALANIFQAEVVIGLQDAEDQPSGKRDYYSAAIHFNPHKENQDFEFGRYVKRVLVPMGEYIPFNVFRKLAASYGIEGSFTAGQEATILGRKMPLGLSICYEEMFGHLIRESRQNGAQLLVNITSDVWFPNSQLTQQHFDHARLRTVENGLPLIRACNTGVTAGVDSLGRLVTILGENALETEWLSDSLLVQIPTYTYKTLYSFWGDRFIIGMSLLFIVLTFLLTYKFR
jgi:apolipoprotein N-acyltransferase